jgi:hypothetical protein
MGEARRRKSDFDRDRADAAFKGLLRAADRLAWLDGISLDHDAIRVIYGDFIFAADQAHQDESPANAEELAAKHADLVVALGVDRIPGFTARYWPDLSPAQHALLERDLDEARQRGGMRTGPSSRERGHTLINAICNARDVVKNTNDPVRVAEAKAIIQNATLELRVLLDNEITAAFPAERLSARQQSAFADLTTQAEALLRGLEI